MIFGLAAFGGLVAFGGLDAFRGLAALGRPADLGRVVIHVTLGGSAFYTIIQTSSTRTSPTLGTLASAFGTFRALGCFVGLA